jgi:alkanesulfonate monooxygenase SsuD/methylene tetrahydromethanopterin reductase-like flavin-dependent oxidoreductase (luciferase family)
MGEHVFSHGVSSNAFVSLAVAAGATERIGLLSAVTLLPLYPAALAAKMAVVLDDASGGRFRLGVGVGGEHEREFRAVSVPVRERGRRTDEALKVIRRLFTGDSVTCSGRWSDLEDVALIPPPSRPGGPPVYVAGRSEPSMRRAGRFGDAWLPYLLGVERVAQGLRTARTYAAEAGRDPGGLSCVCYLFLSVGRDAEAARAGGRRAIGSTYARPEDDRLGRYVVSGGVDECVQQLAEFREAGADGVVFNLSCSADERAAMETLVLEELAPALKQAAATR